MKILYFFLLSAQLINFTRNLSFVSFSIQPLRELFLRGASPCVRPGQTDSKPFPRAVLLRSEEIFHEKVKWRQWDVLGKPYLLGIPEKGALGLYRTEAFR